MIDGKAPDRIDLFLENDGDAMPPLTAIEIQAGEGGQDIVATYDDGTVVTLPYRTDEGVLDIVADTTDEFSLERRRTNGAKDEGAEAVVAAVGRWLLVEHPAVNGHGDIMRDLRIDRAPTTFMTSEDDVIQAAMVAWDYGKAHLSMRLEVDQGPLRAVWLDDMFLGLLHGHDDRMPVVDEDQVARINARLAIVASRMAGEWEVVADECVRLGSTPPTSLKVGHPVKVGIKPVHPLPDDYHAEWVWVKLTSVEDGGARLTGTLLNQPGAFAIDLQQGDAISFSNRDVYMAGAARED